MRIEPPVLANLRPDQCDGNDDQNRPDAARDHGNHRAGDLRQTDGRAEEIGDGNGSPIPLQGSGQLIFRRFKETSRQIARAMHHTLDAQPATVAAIKDEVNAKPSADGK
jgi:hypothetical protein